MNGHRLIIKKQKSPLWRIAILLGGVALVALSFYAGRFLAIEERQELMNKEAWLQNKLDEYQQAYQQANESLVMQAQFAKVDDQSNQQLVERIKQLTEIQQQLEAELLFYRNIMAPELAQEGLTIASFDINQNDNHSLPKFKLVLTQAGKQEQFLKGEVLLKLNGKLDGKPQSYPFNELGHFQPSHFQFQFRYFQNIEGEIELPEGFIAEQVSIVAKTQGLRKNQSVEKQLDWAI